MKIKISDMMDHVESIPLDIREKDIASVESVKEATMKKIHSASSQNRVVRKISKAGVVAAAMAAVLCITAAAAAVIHWGGFTLTGGMSEAEKNALIEAVSTSGCTEYVDKDGYVHYLDTNGEEIMVLTAREAAKYEREIAAANERAVLESTSLVDASTLPLIPCGISELAVDVNGRFAEFALGNGSMILLHPADKDGFNLKAGDTVTVSLAANDKCILEFGQFKDGVFVNSEAASAQQHSHTFEIQEDGRYCFSVMYCSASASILSDGKITIE